MYTPGVFFFCSFFSNATTYWQEKNVGLGGSTGHELMSSPCKWVKLGCGVNTKHWYAPLSPQQKQTNKPAY